MLTRGGEHLHHRLRQHAIARNSDRAVAKMRRQRPEAVRRQRAQRFRRSVFQPQVMRRRHAACQRLAAFFIRQAVGALHDAFMKQPRRQRRSKQRQHAAAAGRFAKKGDIAPIAAEGGNIALYPLQRGDLIQQGEIIDRLAGRRFRIQRRVRKKTKMAEPIVDGDHHHAARGQRFAVIGTERTRADSKAAAMYPDHHRQRARRLNFRRPDIQIEAVFTELAGITAARQHTIFAILPAGVAPLRRIAHLFPRRRRAWRAPAQRPRWRRRIGNTLEHKNTVINRAAQCTLSRENS